jgi:hypothetical protein
MNSIASGLTLAISEKWYLTKKEDETAAVTA